MAMTFNPGGRSRGLVSWFAKLPLAAARVALHSLRVKANRKWAPEAMYQPWLTDQTYQSLRALAEARTAFSPAELYMLFSAARDALNVEGNAVDAGTHDPGAVLILKAVFEDAGRKVEIVRDVAGDERNGSLDHSRRYALVHIADKTFEGTRSHLARLYPLIEPGGILLVAHYASAGLAGVSEAIDGFFQGRRETPLPVTSGQCLVIKRQE